MTSYLSIPNYPHDIQNDIQKALDDYKSVSKKRAFSPVSIGRRSAKQLNVSRSEIRREIIDSQLKRLGTQIELKRRVDERLRTTPKGQAHSVAANVVLLDADVDDLLEFDESDTEHLLLEKNQRTGLPDARN